MAAQSQGKSKSGSRDAAKPLPKLVTLTVRKEARDRVKQYAVDNGMKVYGVVERAMDALERQKPSVNFT